MAQSQYATEDDMTLLGITPAALARFGSEAVEAQLQAASSIADSYIVSAFTLPLVTWDMSLRLAVCRIAAYMLYTQFGFNPNVAQADQLIKTVYESTIKWLEQIRDEELFPAWEDSSGDSPATLAAGPYVISDPPVGFTDRGLAELPWAPCNLGWE